MTDFETHPVGTASRLRGAEGLLRQIHECSSRDLCPACANDLEAFLGIEPETDPETEQDRIDTAGDDLFHSMREDGEL